MVVQLIKREDRKMKLSNPIKVLDLESFLPPDGETKFELSYSQGDLNLNIFYESDDSELGESQKSIRFLKAKHFFKSPFPGHSFFVCPDDRDLSLLDSMVEYENSEMLDAASESSGSVGYRHYRLFLHSSGVAMHVIAQSFEILD